MTKTPNNLERILNVTSGINPQLVLTAVSTKVVLQSVKEYATMRLALWVVRVWFCLIEVQVDSATRTDEKERICVFALFPSTTRKHLEVHSSNEMK